MVGGDRQAVTPWACIRRTKSMELRPHALSGVVREQRDSGPGDHRPGRGRSVAAGLQGVGQEGLDLVRGRGVDFKEVAMLGDVKGVGRQAAGQGDHWVRA